MSFTEWIADSRLWRLMSSQWCSTLKWITGGQATTLTAKHFWQWLKHTLAWFHVFISDRAALEASDWRGMDCTGGTASDPNHVGTEQENGVRRGDSNSGPRVYSQRRVCAATRSFGTSSWLPKLSNPGLQHRKKTLLCRVVRRCQRF